MSLDAADDVARGRVWPGMEAVEKGLVDEIGGLHDALTYVAGLLELDSADDMRIVQLPRPLSPLERVMDLLSKQGMIFEGLRLQGQVLDGLRPYVDAVSVMSADPVMAYEPLTLN